MLVIGMQRWVSFKTVRQKKHRGWDTEPPGDNFGALGNQRVKPSRNRRETCGIAENLESQLGSKAELVKNLRAFVYMCIGEEHRSVSTHLFFAQT